MEDKRMMKECCANCGSCESGSCSGYGMCGCGGPHRRCPAGHWSARLFLALALLAFVFWGGIKLGSLKEQLGGWGRNYGMMGGRLLPSGMMGGKFLEDANFGPGWMMSGYYCGQQSGVKPATPSETAK